MGEITESTRRHYLGADADKDTIPAAGKERGDSYHANDKGKQYYWDGTNWKTGLGYEYVPRAIAAFEKTQADFTLDGGYHDLDISAAPFNVPVGAMAVHIIVAIKDDAVPTDFVVRGNDTTRAVNYVSVITQVANIFAPYMHAVIFIDGVLNLRYKGIVGTDAIRFALLGWWI